MTYYERLNIDAFFGKKVVVELLNGKVVEGVLDLDCINEDWEEDGEPEGIAIQTGGRLEVVYLKDVRAIFSSFLLNRESTALAQAV